MGRHVSAIRTPPVGAIKKSVDQLPYRFTLISSKRRLSSLSAMLAGGKRRVLTTDDLMRRQEIGPRKRQKCAGDEDEDSVGSPGRPAPGEDSQSEGSSVPDEGDDFQDCASETFIQSAEEEDAVPSRFSFKHHRGNTTGKAIDSSRISSLPPTFVGMGVSSSLVSAMDKMSIHTPTEIQVACIPPLLHGTCFYHSSPSHLC